MKNTMKNLINITISTNERVVVYTSEDKTANTTNISITKNPINKPTKRTFIPSNPRAYFMKAIALQRNAFKEDYAVQKLEQSCDTLISVGFCSGCRECNHCALQMAHEETLALLKVPSIVEERRKRWVERQKSNNAHTGFGTRTWKSSK